MLSDDYGADYLDDFWVENVVFLHAFSLLVLDFQRYSAGRDFCSIFNQILFSSSHFCYLTYIIIGYENCSITRFLIFDFTKYIRLLFLLRIWISDAC